MLREQLGAAQEGTAQRMDAVAQELTWRFEGAASQLQCDVVTVQQTEIDALRAEIGRLKLQQESSVRNVEAASMSSVMEMRSIIAGLHSEVAVEHGRRENDERVHQDAITMLKQKQHMAESRAAEFRTTLQTKDQQLERLTRTMSSMLDRVEGLQSQVENLEM